MTRARMQFLLMLLYVAFGFLTLMLPGVVLDVLGVSDADRTPVSLLLTRMFGAVCVGLAIALFFLITDHSAGRRLMRALAGLEAAVVAGAVLSIGADDVGLRAGLTVAILSGLIGLFNLYGGLLAPEKVEPALSADVP